jgi:predicted aspartyl protease
MLRLMTLACVCLTLAGCASARKVSNADPCDPQESWVQETVSRVALTNFGNRLWCVRARICGQPGMFAVDTGSKYTVITPEFAGKLGLAVSGTQGRFPAQDLPGRQNQLARVPYLQFGGMFYLGFYAPVVNLDHINHAMNGHLDGILGNNILSQTGCSFDWQNKVLTLDADVSPAPDGAIPMTSRDHRFYFATQVNGQAAEFALDTGAYGSSITEAELARLQIPNAKRRPTEIWRVDIIEPSPQKETEVTLDTLRLGKLDRSGVSMMIWGNDLIGMDLLESWVLTFDARANWMTLTAPVPGR